MGTRWADQKLRDVNGDEEPAYKVILELRDEIRNNPFFERRFADHNSIHYNGSVSNKRIQIAAGQLDPELRGNGRELWPRQYALVRKLAIG